MMRARKSRARSPPERLRIGVRSVPAGTGSLSCNRATWRFSPFHQQAFAAPIGHVVAQRIIRIQVFALLVEGCDFRLVPSLMVPESVPAGLSHLQKRRLTLTVRADKTDAIATMTRMEKGATIWRSS